jgi:ketosteroid isomerase-like protein
MTDELRDFEQFMKRREAAARAYTNGDAAPLGQITAQAGDATFFSPRGGYVAGAEAVFATYERDATAFAPGSESNFEILQMAASDGLAYWVGFQRATVHMQGRSEPLPFNLRVTEVFRRDGADWKLVHRHADPLATPAQPN